jgi:hypothetical protein
MGAASIALAAATAISVTALVTMRIRMGRAPSPVAPPKGSAGAGVLYALTTASAPWAKESASRHLPSYVAGIVYHIAVATMLVRLAASLFAWPLPPGAEPVLAAVFAAGVAAGASLLIKRGLDARLRAMSVPDDFFSNVAVTLTLVAALVAALDPARVPLLQWVGAGLLLYVPLGKLRHMAFLLTSRRLVGSFYGRRGVRPQAASPGGGRG